MIQTFSEFTSSDPKLKALYDAAMDTLRRCRVPFGGKTLPVATPDAEGTSLISDIFSATALAPEDPEAALCAVRAFLVTQREDGRLPSRISCRDHHILPIYGAINGFCFADEAMDLMYLGNAIHGDFPGELYRALSAYDSYLWNHHDLNYNGALELFSESDAEENMPCARFKCRLGVGAVKAEDSPFPVEAYDLMAMDCRIRMILAELSRLLGNGQERYWNDQADTVRQKLMNTFWLDGPGAFYDRDYGGSAINVLTIGNLMPMYYHVMPAGKADRLMEEHLLDPKQFGTAMPLPTVSFGSSYFNNEDTENFNGQPRGLTYCRALRAYENYGYYSAQTRLGRCLLEATGRNLVFPTQFDPFTGEPSRPKEAGAYAPTASAVAETLRRFYGIFNKRDQLVFGALGAPEGKTVSCRLRFMGSDYSLESDDKVATGYKNGKRLFTVTTGVRLSCNSRGKNFRVVNVTEETRDVIFVGRTYTESFTLAPDEERTLHE